MKEYQACKNTSMTKADDIKNKKQKKNNVFICKILNHFKKNCREREKNK